MCVSARHKLKDLLHSPVIVNFSFSSKNKTKQTNKKNTFSRKKKILGKTNSQKSINVCETYQYSNIIS